MSMSLMESRLRPRPVIPPKPTKCKELGKSITNKKLDQNKASLYHDQPPEDRGQRTKKEPNLEGKVKKLVRRISQQELAVIGQTGLGAGMGSGVNKGGNGLVGQSMAEVGQQAVPNPPPLPPREPCWCPQTQPNAGYSVQIDALPVALKNNHQECTFLTGRENRSAPDGREVDEVPACLSIKGSHGPGVAKPIHHGNGLDCCHCICHLKRPGMRLAWVPLDEGLTETQRKVRGNKDQKREVMTWEKNNENFYIEVLGDERETKQSIEHQERDGKDENKEVQVSSGLKKQVGNSHIACQGVKGLVFSKIKDVKVPQVIQRNVMSQHHLSSNADFPKVLKACIEHSSKKQKWHQHTLHATQTTSSENHAETGDEDAYEIIPSAPPRLLRLKQLIQQMQLTSPQKVNLRVSTPPLSGHLASISGSHIGPTQTPPLFDNPNQLIMRPLPQIPFSSHLQQLPGYIVSRPPPPRPQRPIKSLLPNPDASGPTCSGHTRCSSIDANVGTNSVNVTNEKEDEPKDRTGSPRRISSDWEAERLYEPLYQMYQAKTIEDAIRCQTTNPSASRPSVELHKKLGGSGSLGPKAQAGKGPAEVMLWQELPVVRESGILEGISPDELQRQECMFEVLTSEASYVHSLEVLINHFMMCRDLDDTLLIHDKKTLFSNILTVYEVSQRFFKDLLKRTDENILITDVCDIIHLHALHHFSVYIDYIRNQTYQEKAYSSLMQSNKSFALVMRRLEESPLCHRLPFSSFLLLPFQRITRLKILVQNILKRTKEGTTEETTGSRALASVSEIIKESNTQVGQMKQMEELIQLTNNLEFQKLKAVPIISKTRYLEKRGELHELSKGASLFNIRLKLTPIYLFLFNDLLIITYKKSSERYVVTDHAHRSLVQVQPVMYGVGAGAEEQSPMLQYAFCLRLLENHQGLANEILLKAPSEADMHRWMAAFPSLNDPQKKKKEVIYEDWDCPQVQCLKTYVAQQADELSLEPADIINVIRKTNEGWFEGIRLSDRDKGWFPSNNVVEITNEHLRRRNLREQYHISQAQAKLTNS
ncbi:hypothetical protein UPYG_G00113700 [Umbra pygmaea]|uniref:Rho guanine nucleotide exchange factor 15 n=1 Tax=Umbra pygmaea TaxID=75934 RepID=A0ABD0X7E1_UMBPY